MVVVVDEFDACSLGCRGNQKIGRPDALVVVGPEPGEIGLDIQRSSPFARRDHTGIEGVEVAPSRLVLGAMDTREQLEANLIARGDLACLELLVMR